MEQQGVVILYLNETGKKALGVDKKVLYLNKPFEKITDEDIENIFPLSLVSKHIVKDSFLNLKPNDYVAVWSYDNHKYLGKVLSTENKQISVRILNPDVNDYDSFVNFRPEGIQATHSKYKYHIERITDGEVNEMLKIINNKPFFEILDVLKEFGGIEYQPEKINLPEWMDTDTIKNLKCILDCAKAGEIYYLETTDEDE